MIGRYASRVLAIALVTASAACGGEPEYRGLNMIAYNYTPWDIDTIRISDKSGRTAGSGAMGVGGGEGSVTCCYALKGTEFKVQWSGVDGEEAIQHLYDGTMDSLMFHKETTVHLDPTPIPAGDGPLYLELHIYPDEHMELALSRKLLGQTRFPLVDTTDWLYREYRGAFEDYRDGHEVLRVLGKVARTAWIKYRIVQEQDMRQYMRLYFTVASDFDTDPEIAALLSQPGRQPGDFAKAVAALPEASIARLKAQGTPPGDKRG
ncbi:hypothetical protein HMPREF3069_21090 [Achromobacter xylosoxidans]|jgi:hypothetical protein|nr:DUF3304 domain-containing protein [Achromobacter xylosoxidans]PWY47644.1 DUF3304 domain-containing protein [Achromobacter sp. RW408]OFL44055.1 hypothetical protein HMPREF2772_13540 [Achromobacter xylosoxidans]OFS40023.1 hypothetical protein HMPREF3069_21090 [Achromobacter xylosoxidans]QEQ23769.1 DUF3304 domain-containing protein [Achromobacter xylosoxidans]